MRKAMALAVLAFAGAQGCSTSASSHPVITELRNGTLAISPLPVCAGMNSSAPGIPTIIGDTIPIPSLQLIGSGFVTNVNLVSDDPKVFYGTARFVGPATLVSQVLSGTAQQLDIGINPINLERGEPQVPPGPYDFIFVDSDGGEFRRAHAVDFVLPPPVSGAQPASICPDRDETVTISGSAFTPGKPTVKVQTAFTASGPQFPATATASSVVVTIPAGTLPAGFDSKLVVQDLSGCPSPAVTVAVTQACGP